MDQASVFVTGRAGRWRDPRKLRDIERFVGREMFLAEMRRRGFAVVENAGQFVIFCNSEPIRRVA